MVGKRITNLTDKKMTKLFKLTAALLIVLFLHNGSQSQTPVHPDARYAEGELVNRKANGFKGIWYMNQPSNDEYVYKYSGGMAVYPANHRPFTIYSKKADKTFFCFGGTNRENNTLFHNVSYFDHRTGQVANPTIVLDKNTTDAHDNPVISIDDKGYIRIFSTSHGTGRPSYISRSRKPYSIDSFELMRPTEIVNGQEVPFTNFSYFQVYYIKGNGFIALFTRYIKNRRVIGYNTSRDGVKWNEWKQIANYGEGHYQVSDCANGKVGVAFDYHPKGKGLNWRTNLQYLETNDFGRSWQNAAGETVSLPLTQKENPALVHNFEEQKLNCYLSDIQLDRKGRPAILIISSKGYESGPGNSPREWHLFTPGKNGWKNSMVTTSDNNYDMGSVYLESDKIWKIIGPSADGPQTWNTGGEVVMWKSTDQGESWQRVRQMTENSLRNHCYVRRPLNARADFYGIWADGNGRMPSESTIYICNKEGTISVLPREMSGIAATPAPYTPGAAVYDLSNWPAGKSPQEIGTRVVEKFLKTPHSLYGNTRPATPPRQITYPDVCTWLGGMWFAEATKNDLLFKRLEKRFDPLFGSEKHLLPKPNHVDNNVFGAVPLELYQRTGNKQYLDLGLNYADSQWLLPEQAGRQEKTWDSLGYTWQTRIWIDDMFMITAVQAQAFRATGEQKYIDRAAKEMVLYLDTIQLENGLFYHSPEAHYSWGRGNGWMAVGMTELLRTLPAGNPYRPRIMQGYLSMMAALLRYQAADGMWRQIIDDPESWKETSSTAMFTYALITGVKNGWLDKASYGTAARKGWLALTEYLNENDELTDVCEGTNIKNSRDHYLNRKRITGDLHGQAPLLWCATALIRE